MSLYNIVDEIRKEEYIDEDGVVDVEKLNALNLAFDEKIENIACLIKNKRAREKALAAEEKSFAERKKVEKNSADKLEEYLSSMMLAVGRTKFETVRAKISFKWSTRTEVQEEDFMKWCEENGRQDLLRIKTEISKTAIKDVLQVENLPFVDIVEYQNIQIK